MKLLILFKFCSGDRFMLRNRPLIISLNRFQLDKKRIQLLQEPNQQH
jgi:hypothetical protein